MNIDVIMLDSDNTIVLPKQHFDELCIYMYRKKLREEGISLSVRPDDLYLMKKGDVIDTKNGRILEIDQDYNVTQIKLPHQITDQKDIQKFYRNGRISFKEGVYETVDDHYGNVVGVFYVGAVKKSPSCDKTKLYEKIIRDIDLCHRDDSIKGEIVKSPDNYLYVDSDLHSCLSSLKNMTDYRGL